VFVLLGKGNGRFRDPHGYPAGNSPALVTTTKYNGDGKTDLAVSDANDTNGKVAILRGKGHGKFKAPIKFEVGRGPYGITKGRFNGDKRDDLATANYDDHSASVLLSR
jgi:hypothetical protein